MTQNGYADQRPHPRGLVRRSAPSARDAEARGIALHQLHDQRGQRVSAQLFEIGFVKGFLGHGAGSRIDHGHPIGKCWVISARIMTSRPALLGIGSTARQNAKGLLTNGGLLKR